MLDLLCATPIYLRKTRRNILCFSVPHKILLKVKAVKITVNFYHMQRFSLHAFQRYSSKIDLCEKLSDFLFFYKNTPLWEAFSQNACQGPENTNRCGHSRVTPWALAALTGLTWSPHRMLCPFRLGLGCLSAVLVLGCLDFLAWPWTCLVPLFDARCGGAVVVTVLLCLSVAGAGGLCLVGEVTAHLQLSVVFPWIVAPLWSTQSMLLC